MDQLADPGGNADAPHGRKPVEQPGDVLCRWAVADVPQPREGRHAGFYVDHQQAVERRDLVGGQRCEHGVGGETSGAGASGNPDPLYPRRCHQDDAVGMRAVDDRTGDRKSAIGFASSLGCSSDRDTDVSRRGRAKSDMCRRLPAMLETGLPSAVGRARLRRQAQLFGKVFDQCRRCGLLSPPSEPGVAQQGNLDGKTEPMRVTAAGLDAFHVIGGERIKPGEASAVDRYAEHLFALGFGQQVASCHVIPQSGAP